MPRRSKGARLWLRNARYAKDGKLTHAAVWLIKDGQYRESTGCGVDDRGQAEKRLAEYIGRKHLKEAATGIRAPAAIPIADVLALYGRDIALKHSRPKEPAQRIKSLLGFFGHRTLADINGNLCRAYSEHRESDAAARRELEDLRAAINRHRREGLCSAIVEVVLPETAPPRDRWLTRNEAARMIWVAWRYREVQKGIPTGRRSRQHIARFLLIGISTGTRAGAICAAALEPTEGKGWIDVERGMFYRRPQGERKTKKQKPPRSAATGAARSLATLEAARSTLRCGI